MKTLREQFIEETGLKDSIRPSSITSYVEWLESKLESSQLSEDIAEKNCKNCKYFQNNCHPDVPCSACTRKEHYIFKNDYWITNTKKVELIKKQELLKHCGTCKYLDNGIDMCIDCKADFTNWQPKSNSIA